MTKITFGILIIATCASLLTAAAEARTKAPGAGAGSITNTELGSGR